MKEILRENESNIVNIAEELDLMLWIANDNKSIEWLNQKWLNFAGVYPDAARQTSWYNSMHPEDGKICLPIFDRAFSARVKFEFKCRLKDGKGSYQWMYIKGTPRMEAGNIFMGFAGLCMPIAEEENHFASLQNAMAKQQLLLDNAEASLLANKTEQDRQNTGLESFTYIASHDLQEPLRKIQSFSRLILSKEGANFSDTAKDYFSRITGAAERMQRLIDDLLSYSSTNVLAVVFTPTDLNAVLEEALQNFHEVIADKKVVVYASQLPTIPAIHFQLVQLFTNILSNAIKFSKKEQPLVINIQAVQVNSQNILLDKEVKSGNYWNLTIADNGIGFEPVYNHKIFELFHRLHGKSEYPGTGIGLAICKKIVTNHKGYISASSKPGEGALFNIYLPV